MIQQTEQPPGSLSPTAGGKRFALVRPCCTASARIVSAAALLFALAGCDKAAPTAENAPAHRQNSPAALPSAARPLASGSAAALTAPTTVDAELAERAETASPKPAASSAPPATSYAPRDDCIGQSGWADFHGRLVQAIHTRNAQQLVSLAAPDVQLDYGGGAGRAELQSRLTDPGRGLWDELERILPLGCAVEGNLVVLPWVFWNVPEDIDAYRTMVVLGQDIPLLAKPSATAVAKARLNWSLVQVGPAFQPAARYTAVTTGGGQSGFVETRYLRSLLDYRLIAERQGEIWHITAFIAGD